MADPTHGTAAQQNEEEQKTRTGLWLHLRRIWQTVKWYRRLSKINDWGNWLWSMFTTKAGAGVVAASVVSAGTVGTIAVVKPELLSGWLRPAAVQAPPPVAAAPPAVEVTTERWAQSSVVFPVVGVDKAGRRATFDVVVLTKDYTWVRGSDSELAHTGRSLTEADVAAQVLSAEIRTGLARSSDVIAVGVASAEGAVEVETARADRRARTAARWLGGVLPPATRLWLLNLGQYRSVCVTPDTSDASWQRPFIMIGIRQQEPGVTVGLELLERNRAGTEGEVDMRVDEARDDRAAREVEASHRCRKSPLRFLDGADCDDALTLDGDERPRQRARTRTIDQAIGNDEEQIRLHAPRERRRNSAISVPASAI